MKITITLTLEEAKYQLASKFAQEHEAYHADTIDIKFDVPSTVSFRYPSKDEMLNVLESIHNPDCPVDPDIKIRTIKAIREQFQSKFGWYLGLGYAKAMSEAWMHVYANVKQYGVLPATINNYNLHPD